MVAFNLKKSIINKKSEGIYEYYSKDTLDLTFEKVENQLGGKSSISLSLHLVEKDTTISKVKVGSTITFSEEGIIDPYGRLTNQKEIDDYNKDKKALELIINTITLESTQNAIKSFRGRNCAVRN